MNLKKLGSLGVASLIGLVALGGDLPAGYAQVDYIESTGVQYIDTGYTHTTNTKVVADIYVGSKQRGTWSALFGARGASSTADNAFYFDSRLTTGPVYNRCGSEVKDNTSSHLLTGNRFTITCDGLTASYRQNGATSDTGSITVSGTLSTGFNRMIVFGLNKSSTADGLAPEAGTLTAMKLYSFKIYEGATLVMDLVPCVSPEGFAGVYDTVGEDFKANSGADRFYLPGDPDKLLFARGWIENTITNGTSAHYVDTGYIPTKNSQIETRIRPYAKTAGWTVFFGEQSGDNHTYTVAVRYNGGWQGQFCGGASTAIPLTDEQDYDVALQAGALKAKLVSESDWTTQTISGSNTPYSNSLFLFCSHNTGNGDSSNGRAWRYQKARFYNFKVSESGTLACNLQPARDKATSTIGFYDLTRSKFCSSALASNAFTAYGDPLSCWPEGTTFTAYAGTLLAEDISGYTTFEKAGLLAVDASAVTEFPALSLSGGVLSFADGAATARTVNGTLTIAGGTRLAVDLTDVAADSLTATAIDLASASAASPITLAVNANGSSFATPRVVLAGNLSAADLMKFKLSSETTLVLAIADGALTVAAPDVNSAVTAHWLGTTDGDPAKAENWLCTNLNGDTITAVPSSGTAVYLDAETCNLNVPAGTVLAYKTLTLADTVTLSADCDWSGLDDGSGLVWLAGKLVDVNGHQLTLSTTADLASGTVTSGSAGGSLHLVVPEGNTVANSGLLLQGSLQLVKEGKGAYIAAMTNTPDPYTGGTLVAAGTAAAPERTSSRSDAWDGGKFFGKPNNGAAAIAVDSGATFETSGYKQFCAYQFVLNGGILQNSGYDMDSSELGIGSLTLSADSSLSVQSTLVQSSKANFSPGSDGANSVIALNGHTLDVRITSGKYLYTKNVIARNGTILVRGADGNVGGGTWQIAGGYTAADNVSWDIGCNFELQANATVSNLTMRSPYTRWSATNSVLTVLGTYKPLTNHFCNISMADGSTLDLSASVGTWSAQDVEVRPSDNTTRTFYLTFVAAATVTIDVTGRTDLEALATSAWPYLIAWDGAAKPSASFVLRGLPEGCVATVDDIGLNLSMPALTKDMKLVWNPAAETDTVTTNAEVQAWTLLRDGTSSASSFLANLPVVFDDSAAYTNVVVTDAASTMSVTVTNETKNYVLSGPARASATEGVVKAGAGTLTIDGAGFATGDIAINGGTLKLGDNATANALGGEGTVTIAAGAALDVNYHHGAGNATEGATRAAITGQKSYTIAGNGANGWGAIYNSAVVDAITNNWGAVAGEVELTDDALVGASSRIDFRPATGEGHFTGTNHTLTVRSGTTSSGERGRVNFAFMNVNVDKIVVTNDSEICFEGTKSTVISNGVNLLAGASIRFYNANPNYTAPIKALEGAASLFSDASAVTVNAPVEVATNVSLQIGGSSDTTLADTVSNNGTIVVVSNTTTFASALTGTGTIKAAGGNVAFSRSGDFSAADVTFVGQRPVTLTLPLSDASTFKSLTASLASGSTLVLDAPDAVTTTVGNDYLTPLNSSVDNNLTAYRFLNLVGAGLNLGTLTVGTGSDATYSTTTLGEGTTVAMTNGLYVLNTSDHLTVDGADVTVGAGGLNGPVASATSVPAYDFVSGTLRASADFSATYGMLVAFGNWEVPICGPVTVDPGNQAIDFAGTPLLGSSDLVFSDAPGSFTSSAEFQGALLGKVAVAASEGTRDLSGAGAFAGGLELAANAKAKLNIGGSGFVEYGFFEGVTSMAEAKECRTNELAYTVSSLKRLHRSTAIEGAADPAHQRSALIWRGQFYVTGDKVGAWSFAGNYDDRLAFYVDGASVFETTAYNAAVAGQVAELTEGWHDFTVVAWDNAGGQGAQADAWKERNMSLAFAVGATASTNADDYVRFDTSELKMRIAPSHRKVARYRRHTPADNVAYKTREAAEYADGDEVISSFSVLHAYNLSENSPAASDCLFTGLLRVSAEQAGEWTFTGCFDDRIALTIDGEELLATEAYNVSKTGTMNLTAGWHAFEIRTCDAGGNCGGKLSVDGGVAALTAQVPGGEAQVFDESNFDICAGAMGAAGILEAGIEGDIVLGAGSELENGSAWTHNDLESHVCPIRGTLSGTGALKGPFAFAGEGNAWVMTGVAGEEQLHSVAFEAGVTNRTAFAELKHLVIDFDSQPVLARYAICDAQGVAPADLGTNTVVTITVNGEAATFEEPPQLGIAGGKLVLRNPDATGLMITIKSR